MIDEMNQDGTGETGGDLHTPAAPPTGHAAGEPEETVAELKDRLLRALAEAENLRRRASRDVEEARKYAITNFARGLLEVADNLSRALASVPADARDRDEFMKNLLVGVEMTERSLLTLFERNDVRKIVPDRGEKFDHKLHQAMFELPTGELPPGSIAEVLQPGYVIADRLLRPAMVGVAKAAVRAADPTDGDEPRSTYDTVV